MFCALLFNVTRKSQKSRKYVGAPKISCRRQRTDSVTIQQYYFPYLHPVTI